MLGQLHRLGFATASAAEAATGRGLSAAAQRGVFSTGGSRQGNGQLKPQRSNILAATITENRSHSVDSKLFDAPGELQVGSFVKPHKHAKNIYSGVASRLIFKPHPTLPIYRSTKPSLKPMAVYQLLSTAS